MNRIAKSVAVAVVGAGLAMGTGVATAATASAGTCSTGYACAFDNDYYGGSKTYFSQYLGNFGTMNDRTTSVMNHGGTVANFYSLTGYVGLAFQATPHSDYSNLWGKSDDFRSGCFVYYCP